MLEKLAVTTRTQMRYTSISREALLAARPHEEHTMMENKLIVGSLRRLPGLQPEAWRRLTPSWRRKALAAICWRLVE